MILKPTDDWTDWKAFLAQPDLHWKPGRSAMETAWSWETAKGLPTEIAALFPDDTRLLLAIPEYKVALPGGVRESQNDLFALLSDASGLTACMVEAKRDESFGPTLGSWLEKASDGKAKRLSAICALLGLEQTSIATTLRYQLFHRTASAILTAERFHTDRAAMIVQSFSPDQKSFADFATFAALFGIDAQPGVSYPVTLPNGTTLCLGWATCPPQTEDFGE